MREKLEHTAPPNITGTFQIILRAFRYIKPFRKLFALKTCIAIASLLPILLLPWPIRVIIDHVIEGIPIGEQATPFPFFIQPLMDMLAGSTPQQILFWMIAVEVLLLLVIGSGGEARDSTNAYLSAGQDTATQTENSANAGFSLIGGLFGYFDFRLTMRLTQRLNHHYRSHLFGRIQSLPMRVFDEERIGDAIYRVMYDTPSITNVCYRLLLTPIVSPLSIICTITVMAYVYGLHSPLILIAASFLPLTFLATLPFARKLRLTGTVSRGAGAVTTSTIEEGMMNMIAVQGLGAESKERNRFDKDSQASFGKYRGVVRAGIFAYLSAYILCAVMSIWAFIYVGGLVIDGDLNLGDYGVLIPYFFGIAISCVSIGEIWIQVQENAAGLNRVFFLMDLPGEQEADGTPSVARVSEGVRFDNVNFEYDAGRTVLKDISFEAGLGQFTAIVGPAGAGKTTLAYLIPRFLEPGTGRILLDGTDIAGVSRHSIRSQVAYVFQETVLFDATIEENIKTGKKSATQDEIIHAARTAGALEFIEALPDGFKTRLGSGGGKLSVGQKQRLSIARALITDAPILIFDEPTSALDHETETIIVSAMRDASREHVVIVIAHRLSTIRRADQVLYIEGGQILEKGNHEQLMALTDGRYRRFVELQNQTR